MKIDSQNFTKLKKTALHCATKKKKSRLPETRVCFPNVLGVAKSENRNQKSWSAHLAEILAKTCFSQNRRFWASDFATFPLISQPRYIRSFSSLNPWIGEEILSIQTSRSSAWIAHKSNLSSTICLRKSALLSLFFGFG